MHPARTHPLASMWPAVQRANLCLEVPPRPPLVRAPLALGWAHQAAASPLGRPQHPSRALLEKDLPFPLVQDPSPQGLGNSYRPGGSTLARSSPWPLPPPLYPSCQQLDLGTCQKEPLTFSFHEAEISEPVLLQPWGGEEEWQVQRLLPVLQEAEGPGLWGDGKAGRVAGPKPVTLLEQLHW